MLRSSEVSLCGNSCKDWWCLCIGFLWYRTVDRKERGSFHKQSASHSTFVIIVMIILTVIKKTIIIATSILGFVRLNPISMLSLLDLLCSSKNEPCMMDSGTQGLLRILENQGGIVKNMMRRGAILVTGMYLTIEDVFVGSQETELS